MLQLIIILSLTIAAHGQVRVAFDDGSYRAAREYAPIPYSFAYSSEDVEGTHGHQQTGDGSGRVQGSYTIHLSDGRSRIVNYVADENGYRAEVTTNELGTESKNPADVIINSSAITGEQAALQFGPFAPQPRQPQQLVQRVVGRPQPQINLRSQVSVPTYGTFAGGSVQGVHIQQVRSTDQFRTQGGPRSIPSFGAFAGAPHTRFG